MSDETVPIARVPLARATPRLLVAPLGAVLVGAAAAVAGVLIGGTGGIALGLAGVLTLALGAWLGLILMTIRLDIEVSSIRFHWAGGERRFTLVRGPVTRVTLTGPKAVPLRARFGAFGWTLGRATLRGEERIEIVRLAPAGSLILVPTEGIRLAVAPRTESDLIAALTAAARVQQRLDAARPRMPLPVVPAVVQRVAPLPSLEPVEAIEPAPRVLTGIERVELEQRLAAQRAAALAAAEAERTAQEAARTAAVPAATAARQTRPARRVPRITRPAWTRPSVATLSRLGVIGLPVVVAGIGWGAAVATGHAGGESLRNLVLAFVLAGPATTVGAIGARIWWPRIVPLVIGSSLFAFVLLAGALAGSH